uniref:Uncharacterized protein n=1 Tax=Anguilla anguilla TaxID=7936 RepID=A0A0E9S1C2_ANGAN
MNRRSLEWFFSHRRLWACFSVHGHCYANLP